MLLVTAALGLSLMQAGDEAFKKRYEPEQARAALSSYREVVETEPANREAQWRLAMAAQFVGMRLVTNSDEKKEIFSEGKAAGLRSLVDNEECAACHFWTGINQALYGETVGALKMLFTVSEVQSHLRRAAELDASYAYGAPYRVLGVISKSLPGIFGGSNSDARDYFRMAIAAAPDEPMNYWELLQLEDDKEKAKEIARQVLSAPQPSPERIESHDAWLAVKEWLGEP